MTEQIPPIYINGDINGDGNVIGSQSSSIVMKPYFSDLINSIAVVSTGQLQLTLVNGSYLSVRPEDWPDFRGLISDNTCSFVGRQFVFEELDSFIQGEDTRPGYFRIVADAGIGKTALAAEIARRYNAPAYFLSAAEGRTRWDRLIASLCTQIIARYQLPYSYLPERAGETTDFLQALLREAADREKPVLVVVDGMDEANLLPGRPGTDGLYLPRNLPQGVFFVLTQRPGISHLVPLPGVREETFRIEGDDPYQLADIRELIRVYAERPGVSAALAQNEPAISIDKFVAALEKASQGNFMYLRYILSDIEVGKPGIIPLQLELLPKGLNGYYEQFWRRMVPAQGASRTIRDEWREVGEPTITILGTAQEPVSVDWISRLIQRSVSDILDYALRPWEQFLSCDKVRFPEERWRIVHRSFAEFLAQKIDLTVTHSRIADHYLALWGGFDQNLPRLQTPKSRDADEGYGLRHLVSHLLAAGRAVDVHRVLRAQWDTHTQHRPKQACNILRLGRPFSDAQFNQNKATNVWYWSHNKANDRAGYVQDYLRGWECAERATISGADPGKSATGIGLEMRYALIQSSLNSMAESIPPALLASLVANHHWGVRDAIIYIGRISESRRRAEAVIGVAPYATDYDRPDDFVSIVCGLEQDLHKIDGFIAIATYLPERVFPEIIALLDRGEVKSEMGKARVLASIARKASREQMATLTIALGKLFPNDYNCRRILLGALTRRYVELRDSQNALKAVIALSDLPEHQDIKEILYEVAMGLFALGNSDDALTVASLVKGQTQRADLCIELMLKILEAGQPSVALQAACTIPEDPHRARALVAYVQAVAGANREQMLSEVFREAKKLSYADDRLTVLISLLQRPSGNLKIAVFEDALSDVERVPEVRHQVRFLAALAAVVDEPIGHQLLARAILLARNVKSPSGRLETLVSLLECKPQSITRQVLGDILDLVEELSNSTAISMNDVDLTVATLTEEVWIRQQSPNSFSSRTQGYWSHLAHRLAGMGFQDEAIRIGELSRLPEFRMRGLIDKGNAAIRYADSMKAQWLDSNQQKLTDINYIRCRLKQAAEIPNEVERAKEMVSLSLFVPKAERQRVLQDVWERGGGIDRSLEGVNLRLWLADRVTGEEKEELVRAALNEAYQIRDGEVQINLLEKIASRLPPADREPVLSKALVSAFGIQSDRDRSVFLDRLVPSLSLNSLRSLPDQFAKSVDSRLTCYLELAKRMIPDFRSVFLREAVGMLREVSDLSVRYEWLNKLAPYLSDELLLDAVALTATINDVDAQIETLLVLSVYLPESFHVALFESLSALPNQRRMQILARLTEEFGAAGLDARAFDTLKRISDTDTRTTAAQQLAQCLASDGLLKEALVALGMIADPGTRLKALSTLAPANTVEGRAEYQAFFRKALGSIKNQHERLGIIRQFSELADEGMVERELRALARTPEADTPPSGMPDIIGSFGNSDELASLAPVLSRSQLEFVLREVNKPRWQALPIPLRQVLAALAPRAAQLGQTNEALDMLKKLDSLAQEIEIEYRVRQLDGKVETFRSLDEVRRENTSLKIKALIDTVPFLPEPYQTEQLEQLLHLNQKDRRQTIHQLVNRFAEAGNFSRALSLLPDVSDASQQAENLKLLAAKLPDPLLSQALDIAHNISDKTFRDRAVARYVARLSGEGRDEDAVNELGSLTDDTALGEALSGIAKRAPEVHLESLLELVFSLKSERALIEPFVALASRLPEARVRREVRRLTQRLTESSQVELITRLTSHLASRPGLLEDLLNIALSMDSAQNRVTALTRLAAPWSSIAERDRAVAVQAWQRSTHRLANRSRRHALSDVSTLARSAAAIGGSAAVREIADAVQDVGRWWP